jgi:thiamine-monophosphate kinase
MRIGEREIIRLLTRHFDSDTKSPLGFNDDVAAYPMSRNNWVILKTDMFVGSTDIPLGMSLVQAARKSVVATVSDFAAKGVRPRALLASLGLTSPISRNIVNQLGHGLRLGAKEYGCMILGGDVNRAKDFVIDLVGVGFTSPNSLIRRNGARAGDIVVVTGEFGKTAAGLRLLLSDRPNARRFSSLTKSVLMPRARLEAGIVLASSRAATSSIDSSDGLAWSLTEIARSSRVNLRIERMPTAKDVFSYARLRGLDPLELTLYGGEEYEIVATIKKEKYSELKEKIPSFIRIGTVHPGNGQVHRVVKGKLLQIEPRGWDHFS